MTFEAEWARCAHWIEAALEHDGGSFTIDDVRDQIMTGEAFFWPGRNSAIVGEIYRQPRKAIFNFWLCGGDLAEVVEEMRPKIEEWARGEGCSRCLVTGRPGWLRALAPHGYQPRWSVCAKEL